VELAAAPDRVFFLRADDVLGVLVAGAMFFIVDFFVYQVPVLYYAYMPFLI
jgi:hypothetical protein